MRLEDFNKAKELVLEIEKQENYKKQYKKKLNDLCMKTVSMGQDYDDSLRNTLREFFDEVSPILDKKLDEKAKKFKEELDRL